MSSLDHYSSSRSGGEKADSMGRGTSLHGRVDCETGIPVGIYKGELVAVKILEKTSIMLTKDNLRELESVKTCLFVTRVEKSFRFHRHNFICV